MRCIVVSLRYKHNTIHRFVVSTDRPVSTPPIIDHTCAFACHTLSVCGLVVTISIFPKRKQTDDNDDDDDDYGNDDDEDDAAENKNKIFCKTTILFLENWSRIIAPHLKMCAMQTVAVASNNNRSHPHSLFRLVFLFVHISEWVFINESSIWINQTIRRMLADKRWTFPFSCFFLSLQNSNVGP